MKSLLIFISSTLINGLLFSQTDNITQENENYTLSKTYRKDSILIENIVYFDTYTDNNTAPTDKIKFKVKITNLGSQPIPNLMRISNRSENLNLYYNGKNSYDPNIENGITGNNWPWAIEKNKSDSFETGYVLGEKSGIFTFGNPVSVKWSYMGIDSPIVIVDLKNKTILKK